MRQMHRWLLRAGAAAFSLMGVAASAQEVVQLKFRQFDPPGEISGLVAAVEGWNASHPRIQVKLETMGGGDTLAQLAREVPAGAGPDVQQLAFVWTRDLARSKLLLDLSPLAAAAAPGTGVSDFLATELATLDGRLYGLTWSADTFSMAYRPDLLQKAGVTFPDTWEQLATVAKALSNKDGQHGFCFPAGSSPDSGMWILANYYLWSNGKTSGATARRSSRRRPPASGRSRSRKPTSPARWITSRPSSPREARRKA